MLVDLLIVAVLGAALAWSRPELHFRAELSSGHTSVGHFVRALLRTHLGRLLVLLSIATVLQWSTQVALAGWSSLNPEAATGEVDEETRCHAWQERISREGQGAFAPSELACPAGGGPYARDVAGGLSCPVHGGQE